MRGAGINTILTYTVPPSSLLDSAAEHGLRIIVNVPWMSHVCFLDQARTRREIRKQVQQAIVSCRQHPALMLFCVSKEIPPPIVRWHGRKKIETFLRDLCSIIKDHDPNCLVSYTNFPTTEYLELPFVDVFTFNVYLHERPTFCAYLSRLQHLAGELPLVLTECGMCSFRHTRDGQATFLDWQIEEIFDHGLAGAVVFGWTDPFFQDGSLIEEWGFGLVDADRRPKPSYKAVQRRFVGNVPFSQERRWPKISVVVATYNAGAVLDGCLASLVNLRYPNYEVIVVNDGSTDGSGAIIEQYPFRAITTPNRGVSAARNEGLRAATGDIVAYIDSDAWADQDWLSYLAATFLESNAAGVGGPNFLPPEDNWVANCVYRSPGGPTQVMLNDQAAEHIPGCNMSFWKSALEEVGGFDPIFTKAGDDVDICWRLLEKGYQIGFNPSAVVWHHRRPSTKAYWRQQVGYGFAETLLEQKHPNKFNPWGHTLWVGRIYAPYPFFRMFRRPLIYHGLWGSAPFQSMYDPGGGGLFSFLPRSMEVHVALGLFAFLGIYTPWAFIPLGTGIAYMGLYCIVCAASANLRSLTAPTTPMSWTQRLRSRAMIAWLHLLEPLARDWGRVQGGLTPWRRTRKHADSFDRISPWWQGLHPFGRTVRWVTSESEELEKHSFLTRLSKYLHASGFAVGWNSNWQEWDLKIRRGALGEVLLRMVVEYHGEPKRVAHLSATIRPLKLVLCMQGGLAALGVWMGVLGLLLPSTLCVGLLAFLWMASTSEANRLETGVLSASLEVVRPLGVAQIRES